MPVLQIYSPVQNPPQELLPTICENIMSLLELPSDHAWAFWNPVQAGHFYRPNWTEMGEQAGPVVVLYCKETYSKEQVSQVMLYLQQEFVNQFSCAPESVFITVQRVKPNEVLVRDNIWRGDQS